jgi:hypothetical protein
VATARRAWAPVWSTTATLVVPGLFALTDRLIGNTEIATLALARSVLLIIGTAVNSSTLLAALITGPAAFTVLFAGVLNPNAACGAIAVLGGYR